ncbi:hypothetical protein L596_025439 [Steinernema carpocapsae]|uniref:Uncharacterized protein n=1 Tax=Steinernema carpocapsae TaxID=34508 RepID=A0A4U5M7U8_STECR|nr:hypothetical protein L596_025439 [Steinernema carpocapsae]
MVINLSNVLKLKENEISKETSKKRKSKRNSMRRSWIGTIDDHAMKMEAKRLAEVKNYPDFQASEKFLYLFKKNYRIVSRKITGVVTRKTFQDAEQLS